MNKIIYIVSRIIAMVSIGLSAYYSREIGVLGFMVIWVLAWILYDIIVRGEEYERLSKMQE